MSLSLIVNYRSGGPVLRVRSHGPASAQSRGCECAVAGSRVRSHGKMWMLFRNGREEAGAVVYADVAGV